MQFVYEKRCLSRSKLKPKTEPHAPSPEPPHYEDIVSINSRYAINSITILARFNDIPVFVNAIYRMDR